MLHPFQSKIIIKQLDLLIKDKTLSFEL